MTVTVLENIKAFLKDNVCANIKLQKANDKEIDNYELVNPSVHVGWIPPKGFIPTELEPAIPCLIVGMDESTDDGQQGNVVIRISAVVYSPGLHAPNAGGEIECTPDFQGYTDLLNLIESTVAEISKAQIINGQPIIYPIKWGMYTEEQPHPYWYGWITFSIKKQSYQPAKLVEQYL